MFENDHAFISFWETWSLGQSLSFLNQQNNLENPPFDNSAFFLPALLHGLIGESGILEWLKYTTQWV